MEAPKDLKMWSRQTAVGFLGGMFFGGYRGLLKSRTSEPSPIPANSVVHRAALFVVREGIFTGARIGLFVSLFSALSLTGHRLVGREHVGSFAAAGAITCGLFGAAFAGPRRGLLPAAAFGGGVSGLAAFTQQMLQQKVDQQQQQEEGETAAPTVVNGNGVNVEEYVSFDGDTMDDEEKVKDTIDRLIDRFESNLDKFPTKESLDLHQQLQREQEAERKLARQRDCTKLVPR